MSDLLNQLMSEFGLGFFFLFTIPAFIICGIVVFEICAATLIEIGERRFRGHGDSVAVEPRHPFDRQTAGASLWKGR